MAAPKKDDLKVKFEAAAAAAKQTKKKPDNATLLKLYSYFKQATEGDVKGDRPGGFDFVGGAKYDAWVKLKGMSRDDAMQNYVKQVDKLNREGPRGRQEPPGRKKARRDGRAQGVQRSRQGGSPAFDSRAPLAFRESRSRPTPTLRASSPASITKCTMPRTWHSTPNS